jgi:pimeloyl-ACP methyl ester carboxylesterase
MFDPAEFPEPTMISVNGVELEVFEAGREHRGRPIVLCHGWPEHAFSWRHQMPALADAGYHVIVPNQRGYGKSSKPSEVTDYDVEHLTGDLVALLDHFGYDHATFVGHDWGAMVVWWLALLHPERVDRLVALSMSYMDRGERPWVEAMEEMLGDDFYFVDFNRRPGVADAALEANTARFLRNLYRKNVPIAVTEPGNAMVSLAEADTPMGDPIMSDRELAVFVAAFESSGFTSNINWYRNVDRNWHLLADVDPIVRQPALMIHGARDLVARNDRLADVVADVTEIELDCGHWIMDELPEETSQSRCERASRASRMRSRTYSNSSPKSVPGLQGLLDGELVERQEVLGQLVGHDLVDDFVHLVTRLGQRGRRAAQPDDAVAARRCAAAVLRRPAADPCDGGLAIAAIWPPTTAGASRCWRLLTAPSWWLKTATPTFRSGRPKGSTSAATSS